MERSAEFDDEKNVDVKDEEESIELDDQERELLKVRYRKPRDGTKCAGANCTRSRNKNPNPSFFRFPLDLER